MAVVLLQGVVMRYAWGRHDLIAQLQGRPFPTELPEAELWFGAHRNGASPVGDDTNSPTLATLLDADPITWLGPDVAQTFGAQLPFLLKVLAVNEPLSLQLHPDAACVAELAAQGDPDCVLTDRHPKPEMIVALGELNALCGLLPDDEALDVVGELVGCSDGETWRWVHERIARGGVTAAVIALIEADNDTVTGLLHALDAALAGGFSAVNAPAVQQLLLRYPGERSVAIAVLMRLYELTDGDALFIPPGVLHCYLSGAGVEVMASSDNVLRVGLTEKPCHLPAVVAQLRATTSPAALVPSVDRDGWTTYPADTDWFALSRIQVDGTTVDVPAPARGPQILFTVAGGAHVSGPDGVRVTVPAGTAVLIAANTNAVTVGGSADVFAASLGA